MQWKPLPPAQESRTFSARSPLSSRPASKTTACPSSSCCRPADARQRPPQPTECENLLRPQLIVGFAVSTNCRFWVSAEALCHPILELRSPTS
jgi:hypothetical protein